MLIDELERKWNEQADEYNQWMHLGLDEKLEFAVAAERERCSEDVARWDWLVRHASLGFDSAPSWNAVIRLPVVDADDQTITAIVDSARRQFGD